MSGVMLHSWAYSQSLRLVTRAGGTPTRSQLRTRVLARSFLLSLGFVCFSARLTERMAVFPPAAQELRRYSEVDERPRRLIASILNTYRFCWLLTRTAESRVKEPVSARCLRAQFISTFSTATAHPPRLATSVAGRIDASHATCGRSKYTLVSSVPNPRLSSYQRPLNSPRFRHLYLHQDPS